MTGNSNVYPVTALLGLKIMQNHGKYLTLDKISSHTEIVFNGL